MIFSENYCVIDKYDLSTYEKISTTEIMPRRFTSLKNPQYLPNLSEEQKRKLNLYYDFEQINTTDPNYHFDHDLYINHNNGEIISLYAKKMIRYSTIKNQYLWNKFVNEVELPELQLCKSRIEKMTDETDESDTIITGIGYNPDGTFQNIQIMDLGYNLSEYDDNQFLTDISELTLHQSSYVKGTITLYSSNNTIDYTLHFKYPTVFSSPKNNTKGLIQEIKINKVRVLTYLDVLCREEGLQILTQEQVNFIKDLCVGESTFFLTCKLNDDGTLNKIILHHTRIADFEDLTVS